jgi:hypothetical protein
VLLSLLPIKFTVMKKLCMMALLVAVAGLVSRAQSLSSAKVPATVKAAFTKAHPGASSKWEWEDANYEVNFKENGKIMSCVLDKQGTILETETEVTMNELPAAAQDFIKQHYKGKKAQEVAKITKASGEVKYEVRVTGKELLFDANGKNISKKAEEKEKD